ncbi:hypothetical protein B0T26DRAFT_675608 [Lasiosphaeria miniovina]|uniref:Uncharacterized protein n=1 Tax=Lasiosphaeria miniovina TaxID=1954250 RepID=A0AA40DXH6_9PEZI|nr:uncharacterized protein B0T26DRAFT_675608 [Lasiosphaeria miniovina]KAK0717277.1 hypothetical protein B0T26DRAFT_675608 [Lasiosphaeria miniovina]
MSTIQSRKIADAATAIMLHAKNIQHPWGILSRLRTMELHVLDSELPPKRFCILAKEIKLVQIEVPHRGLLALWEPRAKPYSPLISLLSPFSTYSVTTQISSASSGTLSTAGTLRRSSLPHIRAAKTTLPKLKPLENKTQPFEFHRPQPVQQQHMALALEPWLSRILALPEPRKRCPLPTGQPTVEPPTKRARPSLTDEYEPLANRTCLSLSRK